MNIQPSAFFMLRKPMLSTDVLTEFHKKISEQPDSFENELISLFSMPLLSEAIFVASPSLYTSFIKLEQTSPGKSRAKVFTALYKYLIRMCTRATPFGLFAGFTTGIFSSTTKIEFDGKDPFVRHCRLDMEVAYQIAGQLQHTAHIRRQTLFYPNSSLYKVGNSFRFVENIKSENGTENLLCAIESDAILEKVILYCAAGATIGRIAALLSDEISTKQAIRYTLTLIQMQILVSEFVIHVTGEPYMNVLIGKLKTFQGCGPQTVYLDQIRTLTTKSISPLGGYQLLESMLKGIVKNMDNKPILQTDVRFNTLQCSLNKRWIDLLVKEFAKINVLFHSPSQSSDLQHFKRDFFHRYENNTVPLLQALDCDTGIGYGHMLPGISDRIELLENLRFPTASERSVSWTTLSRLKEKLLEQAAAEGAFSINISEQDLAEIAPKDQQSPYFYWLGSFIANSQQALESGNFQFLLKALGGVSGLELMGRFCHADPALEAWLKNAASAQEARFPDAVFAEIAHLPDPRTANIVSRPHLREYEIVYMAGSTLDTAYRIEPQDLLISVPGGREVVITSKRLNKRVFPQMSTAHNFTRGLAVYQFLCDVARQQSAGYQAWSWGHLDTKTFLPRIEYGHFVISRASWNIDKKRFPALFENIGSFTERWKAVKEPLGIPRYFQICRGDNELLIDSESTVSLQLLADLLLSEDKARLVEALGQSGQQLLGDQNKPFTHEVAIPFTPKDPPLPKQVLTHPMPQQAEITTNFAVGSPWLYVKIYTGTSTADRLLSDLLGSFCNDLLKQGLIEKWFFIRYQDPSSHIRIRFFHHDRPDFWHTVLSSLHERLSPMMDAGVVSSIQTDIYKRELQRYDGLPFSVVESIFHADSEATIQILRQLDQDKSAETSRWLAGLCGVDQLMKDLGLTLLEKIELTEVLYRQFFTEFNGSTDLTVQLNNQFREHRALIESFIPNPGNYAPILLHRSRLITRLLQADKDPSQWLPGSLAASFVHMFLNRLFLSNHRKQELVIYHYLNKYYKSLNKNSKYVKLPLQSI